MTKEQYKRLLQLRKSEEEMFYQLLKITKKKPRELIDELPINRKRALYILKKWSEQGKYDYGVSLDLGWITEQKDNKELILDHKEFAQTILKRLEDRIEEYEKEFFNAKTERRKASIIGKIMGLVCAIGEIEEFLKQLETWHE